MVYSTPMGSNIKKNGEHVIIMEQTNGKLTMTNNRFVVMANRPPDLSLIKEQFHDLFEGRYIIMVDFGRVTIANLENDKQQNYYHEYEINMQHQNYITWVQSIIPHWKTSNNRKKNKLLSYDDRLRGCFDRDLEKIQNKIRSFGFEREEVFSLYWLVNHFSRPDYDDYHY
jgi:hypothetical protein